MFNKEELEIIEAIRKVLGDEEVDGYEALETYEEIMSLWWLAWGSMVWYTLSYELSQV